MDRVNAALPNVVTVTRDHLHRSLGFRDLEPIIKAIPTFAAPTLHVQRVPRNPFIDPGEVASLKAANRNTSPSTPPRNYGDIWHADIGFGPGRAIGGVNYALLLVDKATRQQQCYPLKNLTTSLLRQMKQFITDVHGQCKEIRTDFDNKLIGGNVWDYLTEKTISISAAPPSRQHQN